MWPGTSPGHIPYAEAVNEVTDATFADDVLGSDLPVVVDVWAPGCRPCEAIEPHLEALAREWEGRVRFVRVNIDENLGIQGYGILSIPTVLLFEAGTVRARVVGAQPRARYETEFAEWV